MTTNDKEVLRAMVVSNTVQDVLETIQEIAEEEARRLKRSRQPVGASLMSETAGSLSYALQAIRF